MLGADGSIEMVEENDGWLKFTAMTLMHLA